MARSSRAWRTQWGRDDLLVASLGNCLRFQCHLSSHSGKARERNVEVLINDITSPLSWTITMSGHPLIVIPPIAPGHFLDRPPALMGDGFCCPTLRSQSCTWSVLGAFVPWYSGPTQKSVKGLEDNVLAKRAALCSLHETERGLLQKLWMWQWMKRRNKLCLEKGGVYFPDIEKFRIIKKKQVHASRHRKSFTREDSRKNNFSCEINLRCNFFTFCKCLCE